MKIIPAAFIIVDDEGALQGRVNEIDFVGAGVTAVVAGVKATVTIPGGSGGDLPLPETGALSVATANYHQTAVRHAITGTQRITLAGTGRLRLLN